VPVVAPSALLVAASVVGTIVWCTSMSAMGEMPMPGGWTDHPDQHGTCAR
jgi:hypothetical protein